MLLNQMYQNRARELALHYLAHTGEHYVPAVYLKKLKELESEFFELLKKEDKKA